MELKDILNIKIFKTEKGNSETCCYFAKEKEFEINYKTKTEIDNINTVGELLYFAKLDGINKVKDFTESLTKQLRIKIYDCKEMFEFCFVLPNFSTFMLSGLFPISLSSSSQIFFSYLIFPL